MKCPICQREIEGPEFASHYQICFSGRYSGREPKHSGAQHLSAMQAEALARKEVGSAFLREGLATRSSVFLVNESRLIYLVEEWTFTYATAGSTGVSIVVDSDGTRVQEKTDVGFPASRQFAIEDWVIDSDEACALAEQYGGHLQTGSGPFGGGGGLFRLTTGKVDGNIAPLWLAPHRLRGRPLFIRADTGSLVYLTDSEQRLFTETIPAELDQGRSGKKSSVLAPPRNDVSQSRQDQTSTAGITAAVPVRKRHPHRARPGPIKSMIWTLLIIAGLGTLVYYLSHGSEAASMPDIGSTSTSSDVPSQSQNSASLLPPVYNSGRSQNNEYSGDSLKENRRLIVITPLRTQMGIIYGAEAHDKDSGALLAVAKQVEVEGDLLIVEEVQYSSAHDVVYKGKLFFSADDELVKEEPISGTKRWRIFDRWISDGF